MEVETVDAKTQVVDLPNQVLQMADGSTIFLSGAIVYHIEDVKKIWLNVQDPDEAMQTLATMELADYICYSNLEDITNQTLEAEVLPVVADQAAEWGIVVKRVGITHLAESAVYFLAGDETVGMAVLPED
jgi:regulator of protease activity HflC (stomatin/prohibitin superfamily)